MSQYCGPVNVTISKTGSASVFVTNPSATCVSIQPFSASSMVKHAPTHYLNGNDPINHNQLSGLQGGKNNEFYHLGLPEFNRIISGTASFITAIPSGVTSMDILFPNPLADIPIVISNVTSPYTTLYLLNINDITTTGFKVGFSSAINNTGYKLQTLAYTP